MTTKVTTTSVLGPFVLRYGRKPCSQRMRKAASKAAFSNKWRPMIFASQVMTCAVHGAEAHGMTLDGIIA